MYTDIGALFEWRRAIDTGNKVWQPPKEYIKLDKQFIVVKLTQSANVCEGDIVVLSEVDPNNNNVTWLFFKFPYGSDGEYLYWCEVQPYE